MTPKLNFSLTQLEYIQAVARHGHFAKAAESCNVTQPTLSMQIQKLEEHLGVTIFDRTKKPILLTEVGKKILEQTQLILSESKKIEMLIQTSQTDKKQGLLTVGIIPTIAPYLLPLLLPSIDKMHPGIELNLIEMQTSRIIDALNNDEIDVGILAIPLKIPKIFEHGLYYEPFSVLCRNDHELADKSRVKYNSLKFGDIWLLEEGHCLRHQVIDVCSIKSVSKEKRKYKFESGSIETLKNLVNSYGGYTLVPELASHHLGSKTKLIPFERPIPAREIGLVYRREHFKLDLIESLAEGILAAIPPEIQKLRQKDLDVIPVE